MRVVFRTEGDHKQGMGDVMGCLAIAEHCRDADDAVLFLVARGAEAVDAIRSRGYAVETAADEPTQFAIIEKFAADVVIVNMLSSPVEMIRTLRSAAPMLVTLDDNGPGARESDLRVNVLYHTPDAITDLSYIALREEFQRAHAAERTFRPAVESLLVMQGGADTYGFLPKIVNALVEDRQSCLSGGCNITLITGPAFQHQRELDAAIARSGLPINVIANCTTMAEVMRRADMAITAGGMSMYELACVGTPSIVVCAERWEIESATRLEHAGIVRNLGFGADVSEATIAAAVSDLAADVNARREMAQRGRAAIDGRGAGRIASLIRSAIAEWRSLA